MAHTIPESDWKLLGKLRPLALERMCQRVLDEIGAIAAEPKSSHERYLEIYALTRKHDNEIADGFNDVRRSTAYLGLAAMRSLKLISDEEFSGFSKETQDVLKFMLG
ncbi:MAG: hypothetical protein JWN70_695 [Planctomycetaceae bacterium]|nr:hypothetical protein [Planctomycetaceae bacterium]